MAVTTRPSSRTAILDTALALLRDGGTLSLESAARAAGLTKPGLMYHFPTKEALMTGLVDHVIDSYDVALVAHLPENASTAEERLAAYVDWVFTADICEADLVIFTDPRLRQPLRERWTERMRDWLDVPAGLPAARRARLLSARLIADGSWFADASGILPLSPLERQQVREVALALIKQAS